MISGFLWWIADSLDEIKNMKKEQNMKKGTLVKYKAPGWENKIGKIYSVSGDKVMVQFGKHDFVEVYRDEIIFV